MTPRNDQSEHRLRRGGTLGGVLVLLSIIAALSVTTVVFAPRYLQAGAAGPPVVAAGSPVHQELADGLAALIRRSVGVLAVHQRGPTPYVEVVLWLEDRKRPGRADESELAVVSHSAVLRTITIYRLTGSEAGPRVPLDGSYAVDAAFCDRWRADPRVVPSVLMSGVSDMQVERLRSAWDGIEGLWIRLTWPGDSVDGPDEASAVVEAVMFPLPVEPSHGG